MTDVMNGILSRVLSQEIAHQEIWQQQEVERFGKEMTGRNNIIKEIQNFMIENDIPFRNDFYLDEF